MIYPIVAVVAIFVAVLVANFISAPAAIHASLRSELDEIQAAAAMEPSIEFPHSILGVVDGKHVCPDGTENAAAEFTDPLATRSAASPARSDTE